MASGPVHQLVAGDHMVAEAGGGYGADGDALEDDLLLVEDVRDLGGGHHPDGADHGRAGGHQRQTGNPGHGGRV